MELKNEICKKSGCTSPKAAHRNYCWKHENENRKAKLAGTKCIIKDCEKPINTKKYKLCSNHYERFKKYGDAVAGSTSHHAPINFIISMIDNCKYNAEQCVDWPYATTPEGYGTLRHEGKNIIAHRLSCALYNGFTIENMPDSNVHALHKCPNGSRRICINPLHLKFGTHQENMSDKARENRVTGSKNANAKLNESDIVKIRISNMDSKQLSVKYGVTSAQIKAIIARRSWKHIK